MSADTLPTLRIPAHLKPVDGRATSALSLSSDLRRITAALDAREGAIQPA